MAAAAGAAGAKEEIFRGRHQAQFQSFGDVLSDQFLDFAGGFPLGPENADSLSAMNTPKRPCLPLLKSMAALRPMTTPSSRSPKPNFPPKSNHTAPATLSAP